jgi:hypothetical protein
MTDEPTAPPVWWKKAADGVPGHWVGRCFSCGQKLAEYWREREPLCGSAGAGARPCGALGPAA